MRSNRTPRSGEYAHVFVGSRGLWSLLSVNLAARAVLKRQFCEPVRKHGRSFHEAVPHQRWLARFVDVCMYFCNMGS